jgi:hypothetical protein
LYSDARNERYGTREMSFAPTGFADDVYSKYRASSVAFDASNCRFEGLVLSSMTISLKNRLDKGNAVFEVNSPAAAALGVHYRKMQSLTERPSP